MAIAKRVLLFIVTNILILTMVTIVFQVLGIDRYMAEFGGYEGLLIFCLVWGMGGAFISLMLSKVMAKWMMGVKIINPRDISDQRLQELVQTVHRLSQAAGIGKPPEVGVYESPEINAFATGPSKNNSLVAVSTGLLQRLNHDEMEGVLGHEVAHIANGDMVTMTLIQGVINAFVMFLARIIARIIISAMSRDRDGEGASHFMYFVVVMALQLVFGVLGSIVVSAFSRWREFRADSGGARLAGRGKMIAALEALKRTYDIHDDQTDDRQAAVAALKISGRKSKLLALLSTHPPLDVRIQALRSSDAY